jgi:2,5-diketo-D-gluconate reductase A
VNYLKGINRNTLKKMKDNNKQVSEIKRRKFLQTGIALGASAMFLPLNTYKVFGQSSTLKAYSIPTVTLNNGVEMPMLGFGTNTLKGSVGVRCVKDAISVGYRLIDTATVYGNEDAVGEGIKQSGIKREKLFLTSKLWVSDSGYASTKKALETSLKKLGVDYLDLYLIHRPRGDVKGTWEAMQELNEKGKIRAIGISNFEPDQLHELMEYANIKPTVNQIETHVFFQQQEAQDYLKNRGVQMEAWSPFAAGRNEIFTNKTIADIGKKYNKTNAQVCLRWLFQRGIVAIPRSSQKAHMIENLDIFNFELSAKDLEEIAELDLNVTQFPEWG